MAFVVALGFFLLLRIADEFKDAKKDAEYRPQRPVPRGVVSLRELGWIGGGTALGQLGLTLWLDPRIALVLLVAWAYVGLMSVEFFVGKCLEERPGLYVASHMVILPLLALLATAYDWAPAGDAGRLDEDGRLWLLGRCHARIDDERGTVYPFPVESAARTVPGVRRAAYLAHHSDRVLGVEPPMNADPPSTQQLRTHLSKPVDDLVVLDHIPVDRRHNAKIEYPALQSQLDRRRSSFHTGGRNIASNRAPSSLSAPQYVYTSIPALVHTFIRPRIQRSTRPSVQVNDIRRAIPILRHRTHEGH